MDEKYLKTSTRQRIIFIIIAFLMVFSFVATYVIIVMNNSKNSSSDTASKEDYNKVQEEYSAKQNEIDEYASTLSEKYFNEFKGYKSEVKAYNAATINTDGLTTRDLKAGTGRELKADDTNYLAYYIGWCADESIFDSSFNDKENPTSLTAPISAASGLIEGWNQGVIGMKVGGVRELSIPGELAYGESKEICGGKNSPLKFIVMTVADEKMEKLSSEKDEIYSRLIEAYYSSQSNQ